MYISITGIITLKRFFHANLISLPSSVSFDIWLVNVLYTTTYNRYLPINKTKKSSILKKLDEIKKVLQLDVESNVPSNMNLKISHEDKLSFSKNDNNKDIDLDKEMESITTSDISFVMQVEIDRKLKSTGTSVL